ncbi:hypothetical protein ABZ419_27260 [Streptomyces cinnamoneus]|uniref:hypothetical protein n=1 Tax=Streptomyces cinnamoneus TaxID=53446 RepID=UPI0033FC1965
MTGRRPHETDDGITDRPVRAALTLLALGLLGPVVTLHGQAAELFDAAPSEPPVAASDPPLTEAG